MEKIVQHTEERIVIRESGSSHLFVLYCLLGSLISCLLFIILTGCVAGHCSVVATIDSRFSNAGDLPPLFLSFFLFFTYLVNPQVIIIVSCAALVVLVIVHEKILAALFTGGLLFGGLLVFLLKDIVARPRPIELNYFLSTTGSSFPSGHALIAVVFYGFTGYCLYRAVSTRFHKAFIVLDTGLLIFLIGMSRVLLNVHWFSDVIGGYLLGLALLFLLIALYHLVHIHLREEVSPFLHGTRLIIILLIFVIVGFFIMDFYVIHPLVVRSILTI